LNPNDKGNNCQKIDYYSQIILRYNVVVFVLFARHKSLVGLDRRLV
jgi:hypothetical protein